MRNREEASELSVWLRPEQLMEAVRDWFSGSEAQGASDLSLEAWGVWRRKVGGQLGAWGGGGGGSMGEREANTGRGWEFVKNLEKLLLNSI